MTKEDIVKGQLQQLGVYDPAFDPEIHTLCVMERELSRAMKAWKQTAADPKSAPDFTKRQYTVICNLRRDILTHRTALGLTPKGLQSLRKAIVPASTEAAPAAGTANQNFASLMDRIQEVSHAKE